MRLNSLNYGDWMTPFAERWCSSGPCLLLRSPFYSVGNVNYTQHQIQGRRHSNSKTRFCMYPPVALVSTGIWVASLREKIACCRTSLLDRYELGRWVWVAIAVS